MSIGKKLLGGAVVATLAFGALPGAANAAPTLVEFYKQLAAGQMQRLGNDTAVVGGITVTSKPAGSSLSLVYEKASNAAELGFGVCSSGEMVSGNGLCSSQSTTPQSFSNNWNGDISELDNAGTSETMKLDTTASSQFLTGYFILSSLDTSQNETGYVDINTGISGATVVFGNTGTNGSFGIFNDTQLSGLGLKAEIGTLDNAPGNAYAANVAFLRITDVNMSPLSFTMATFGAGCGSATIDVGENSYCGNSNNDYLVAAASVVPLPATLPLFLAALGGLGMMTRKRRAA